jgi:LuxR family transcriptional regulator, maltose regulon positive regulatory protein
MTEGTVDTPQASRRKIIERPRLTRLLDESPARIKMLIAPAGYGKTTLARQWVGASARTAAWMTANATAIDLAAFAASVGAACSTIVAGASTPLEGRLHVSGTADNDALVFAEMLAADLQNWPADAILVVDDYHRVGSSRASEDFFDHLLGMAPINVLLAARRRPRWATAKKIVYGEIFEIDKQALAMTVEEASTVLSERWHPDARELLDLAEGWPAVLGLAHTTTSLDLPREGIPTTLYEYLADEVYQALLPEAQEILCVLSLLPASVWPIVEHAIGARAVDAALAHGENVGVITRDLDGAPDIHPLLRRYLRRRLRDHGGNDDLYVRLWTQLLVSAEWDAAFDFAVWTGRAAEIPGLLEAGLDDMLDRGRTASVAKWLERAGPTGVTTPIVRIAAAEISARQGSYRRAEMLAGLAAGDPTAAAELRARALVVAGHAAHLMSRDEEAMAYYRDALDSTSDRKIRQRAEWGVFISQVDLGLAEASRSLKAIEMNSSAEPGSIVAAMNARLLFAMRFGPLSQLDDVTAALQIVKDVPDPLRRCGFWATYGWVLGLRALYDEAARAVIELEEDALEHRLDFTRPYSRAISAIQLLGQREFERAAAAAEESRALAANFGDTHGVANALAILGRIELSQQRYQAAERLFRPVLDWQLMLSMRCEIQCCYALARACQGHSEYFEHAEFGEQTNCGPEARVLSACAHAIYSSVSSSSNSGELATRAVHSAIESGNYDSLVVSYRAHPEFLLSVDLRNPQLNEPLRELMSRVGDAALSQTLGLSRQKQLLSRRETEIHSLIAVGLTNRQIAERLVISEATVKLHVHHILEKLGVKTRTAAVARKLAGG